MACNLYIGPSLAGSPPSPAWANPNIQPQVSNIWTDIQAGDDLDIDVTVGNGGDDPAPQYRLVLQWADPSTGFMPVGTIDTYDFADGEIGPKIGAVEGSQMTPFTWANIPAAAATTNASNPGHVCLRARLNNLVDPGCVPLTSTGSPTLDKMQGIRNIHVHPATSPMMAFSFAASNDLPDEDEAVLEVEALDPKRHRKQLEALLADQQIFRMLAPLGLKFGVPDQVYLGEGRERARVDPKVLMAVAQPEVETDLGQEALAKIATKCGCGRRRRYVPAKGNYNRPLLNYQPFHVRGGLTEKDAKLALLPHSKLLDAKKPVKFQLLPFERRQTIVQIDPCKKNPDSIYVVNVKHTTPNDKLVGGLTIIFVPPRDFF